MMQPDVRKVGRGRKPLQPSENIKDPVLTKIPCKACSFHSKTNKMAMNFYILPIHAPVVTPADKDESSSGPKAG